VGVRTPEFASVSCYLSIAPKNWKQGRITNDHGPIELNGKKQRKLFHSKVFASCHLPFNGWPSLLAYHDSLGSALRFVGGVFLWSSLFRGRFLLNGYLSLHWNASFLIFNESLSHNPKGLVASSVLSASAVSVFESSRLFGSRISNLLIEDCREVQARSHEVCCFECIERLEP